MRLISLKTNFKVELVLLGFIAIFSSGLLHSSPLIKLGDSINVHVIGSIESKYNSNIFSNHANVVDDFILTVSPGLKIESGSKEKSKAEGSLTIKEHFDLYADRDELDGDRADVSFQGSYDAGGKLKFDGSGSYMESSQNTETENLEGELIRSDKYDLALNAYMEMTAKTKVHAGFKWNKVDFQKAGFLDRNTYVVPLNYYYAYSTKLDFGVGYQFRYTDLYSMADIDEHYFNLRAIGEIAPSVTNVTHIGVVSRYSDVQDSELNFSFGTSFEWKASKKLTFNAGLDRDNQTVGTGDLLVYTGGNIGVKYNVSNKIVAGLNTSFKVQSYESIDREQEQFSYNCYMRYTYSKYVNYMLGYSYFNNDSTTESSNFHNHIVNASANVKY